MIKNNRAAGFTLMELLVVVSIIGILAAVVVTALGDARKKGADSAIKSNLHTAINEAELFYADHGESYLPAGGSPAGIGACPSYNTSGGTMFEVDKPMADAIAEAARNGEGSACYNSASRWAIAVGLRSNPGASWCVDNTGVAREVAEAPADAINPATFACY